MPPAARISATNRLVGALPPAEYLRLISGCEPVDLAFGQVLHQPGDPILLAYFPVDSLVSLLAVAGGRAVLEVGMVGNEGMAGISLALGIGVSPVRAVVQEAGTALRIDAGRFRRELGRSPSLRRDLLGYAHALMTQAAQTAVCSRFHRLEARLARLLLMTRDRTRSDDFRLTHEFLAQMLGVRRVGVTRAAGMLQCRQLIRYHRGDVRVLDRSGLEAVSCRCYERVGHARARARRGRADGEIAPAAAA